MTDAARLFAWGLLALAYVAAALGHRGPGLLLALWALYLWGLA